MARWKDLNVRGAVFLKALSKQYNFFMYTHSPTVHNI